MRIRKKTGIILAILAVIIVSVAMIIIGQLKNQTVKTSSEEKKEEVGEMKIYDDGYIKFEYSNKYEISEIESTDGRVITNIMLSDKSTGTNYTVNLAQLSQSLNDLPSVQMRRSNKMDYSEEVGMIGNLRGLLFRTLDRKERMFFVKNQNVILTILTITNSDSVEIETEFQNFLKSLKWL